MEYMSTAKDLAGPWGQIVLLICVVAIMLGLLIRMMKQTADSVSALRSDIREFEKEQKDRDLKQDAEIHFIRENYVRKEDMYRELGGWKTELNRLGDRIDRNQQENQKLLLELTKAIKEGKGEEQK